MKSTKDKDKNTKKPYETPRLFGLNGGVAHAAGPCGPGGSPIGAACTDGSMAWDDLCQAGGTAGGKCKAGTGAAGGECKIGQTAGGGDCKDGGSASKKCKKGSSP